MIILKTPKTASALQKITPIDENTKKYSGKNFIWREVKPLKNMCGCLAAGTGVLTETGYQPIETLKIGDKVFSPRTKKYTRITNCWRGREHNEMVRINHRLVLTKDHPVFTPGGFVRAGSLKDGDTIVDKDGKILPAIIESTPYHGDVYNIDVENISGICFVAEEIAVGDNKTQNSL
jgi:hypothetical protein